MQRQLRRGNVGEALFRLWTEDHATDFPHLEFRQQGYNPHGVVDVDAKRSHLKKSSDPDFAVVRPGSEPPQYLIGVSVNTQKRPYTAASTMGGLCIRCPRAVSCLDGHEANVWYNRYNITNDYPQFRARFAGIDVVLATLWVPSIDTIFNRVKKMGVEELLLEYIRGGVKAIAGGDGDRLLEYLRYGHRTKKRRNLRVVYALHSQLVSGEVPSFITGGLSQFGRPREVCCVDVRHAHSEDQLVAFLKGLR